jgi:hypothetical protein
MGVNQRSKRSRETRKMVQSILAAERSAGMTRPIDLIYDAIDVHLSQQHVSTELAHELRSWTSAAIRAAVEEEREACAEIVDEKQGLISPTDQSRVEAAYVGGYTAACRQIVDAIRKRGA